jgi:hypothetical protein
MSRQVGVGRWTFDVEYLGREGKSPGKLRAKLRDPLGPAQINEASYHRLNVAAEEVKIEVFNLPVRNCRFYRKNSLTNVK